MNMTENLKFVFGRAENIVGKGENVRSTRCTLLKGDNWGRTG